MNRRRFLAAVAAAPLVAAFPRGRARGAAYSWLPAAPMRAARSFHAVAPLPDGRVLVVAFARAADDSVNGAEIYDPVADRWQPTAPVNSALWSPTATALPDGTVLVAGGAMSRGYSTSSARYDPRADAWRSVGPLRNARGGHTATLLRDGSVLVFGGADTTGSAAPGAIERYDPRSETWRVVASFSVAFRGHTATLLADDTVLFVGGCCSTLGGDPALPPTNIWSGTWRYGPEEGYARPATPMSAPRQYHAATALPDGTVLVTGGRAPDGVALNSAERYDPATDRWMPAPPLRVARAWHSAVALADGTVLVVGGVASALPGIIPPGLDVAERYDPAAGCWRLAGRTHPAGEGHTLTPLPDGGLLLVGGGGVEFNRADATAAASRYLPDPPTALRPIPEGDDRCGA